MTESTKFNSDAIAHWLFGCCGLIFAIVIVGAITRLSNSGLSMVEWRPLMGVLPPLGEAEWLRVFELYQQSPQYQKVHFWMEIDDFKLIFFWEWLHRLLGRLIGAAYFLPLAWFWVRGVIPEGYKLKLLGILALGAAQGFMGWYMVKSGLADIPEVSHYRLAAHLSLAFLIISLLLWIGLSIKENPAKKTKDNAALYIHGWIALIFLILTISWGAFTAGLDAGLIYNQSFPKMGEYWAPPEIWQYNPFWVNFFKNLVGVQFTHRWLAIFTSVIILSFWGHAITRKAGFTALHALGGMVIIQVALGVSTLLSGIFLPLAILHQAGALVTLMLLITCLHRLRP